LLIGRSLFDRLLFARPNDEHHHGYRRANGWEL
jgi:hypothetical protein